ncbi:MAG TPA: serine hydrolase domain-containing protein, partial [Bacteroidales bacterium]|nr:serine hydrolase domain-containing protein [Bacteroidales bacterium]
MKKIILFAISVFIFAFAKPQDSVENLILLENYYQKSIADWNVPGMAVAIVSADSILFARGFGVCDVEKPAKVDENTLFAVASNTKAFTSTALAILVDEGKLRWDDKVQQHLSWFRLYDPYVSYNITIKDLLSHRSGLKTFSGDLIWYGSNYSREEVIRKAAFLKPSYGFRERFGYSNIMYLTAGEIIPQLTNQSWDNFVEQRLLRPIGMMRSVLHVSDLKEISNVAQPHTYVNGELIKLPWLAWDNIGPAGSLISSAKDMGLW